MRAFPGRRGPSLRRSRGRALQRRRPGRPSGPATETCVDTVRPIADGTSIVSHGFTGIRGLLFVDHLIPDLNEVWRCIAIEHGSIVGAADVQLRSAGSCILYDQVRLSNEAGVIANLPLHTMLPVAPDPAGGLATVSRGHCDGGVMVLFHRAQTAIGSDIHSVGAEEVPPSFAARAGGQVGGLRRP